MPSDDDDDEVGSLSAGIRWEVESTELVGVSPQRILSCAFNCDRCNDPAITAI